jgi:hypothetical protein
LIEEEESGKAFEFPQVFNMSLKTVATVPKYGLIKKRNVAGKQNEAEKTRIDGKREKLTNFHLTVSRSLHNSKIFSSFKENWICDCVFRRFR